MNPHFYLVLAAIIMVGTAVLMWRRGRSERLDLELYVAFIRRDFPQQRETAQEIAARIAPIVGCGINDLRPEHTLKQIFEWSHDSISAVDFATAFGEEFAIALRPAFSTSVLSRGLDIK
ncbi:MAG TPA: hypothetical protein VFK65_02290 [Candidatus Binatia bacterium]|nr:hypothetical protein [Candidatus Binatia bacterium]